MKFAMVFPGQGSQSVGMLRELAAAYPVVLETFATASRVLGYDLWALVQQGPEEQLNQTERTQPAMLAAGVAVWRAWRQAGGAEPAMMAGHSLGEYTALVCAESLAFEDAVALVAERGRLMQQAVPAGQGAMAAILGLADEQVALACAQGAEGQVVAPANFNSPGQVVVAGQAGAVARVVDRARALGAKRAVLLPVSVPSHCELMRGAAQRLAERLTPVGFCVPRVGVLHNIDAATRADAGAIREALAAQLHRPVRWVDCVRRMAAEGVEALVEAGPGKVLAGLTRRIASDLQALPVADPVGLEAARAQVGSR
jgi:[acyl-carrier-protein] S-malonyltransferase